MDKNKKTISPILVTGLILFGISLIPGFCALWLYHSVGGRASRELTRANRLLNAGSVSEAEAAFRSALAIDPSSSAAHEGLMQLAYDKHDLAWLSDEYQSWLDLQIAAGNTGDERIPIMQDVLRDAEQTDILKDAVAAAEAGDIRLVSEQLEKLPADAEAYAKSEPLRLDCLLHFAEEAWDQRDTAEAMEELRKANAISPGDERVRDAILKAAREQAIDLMYDQEYEEAVALMDECIGIFGRDVLEDVRAKCEELRKADELLQGRMEKLQSAYKDKDNEKLTELLQDEKFREASRLIRTVLYSSEAKNGGEEAGVAIYSIGNRPYVYFGSFDAEGKRKGNGGWCFSDGEGKLTRYELNWENDLPEGSGSCDRYNTITKRDEGGTVIETNTTHEHDSFTVEGGVMCGDYHMQSEVISDYPYEYAVDYSLKNGYVPRIEPEDYPELIALYMPYPVPLAGWTTAEVYDPYWKENYTTTIWYNWTPNRWGVDGITPQSAAFAPRKSGFLKEE
ncbi:MAG: hypothetical protein K6E50_11205 [Lachnospiraceae bacterium]|nr:hypothetical protein [Lachnospiraceae bacterium]